MDQLRLFRTFSASIFGLERILGRWPRLLHFAPSALEETIRRIEIFLYSEPTSTCLEKLLRYLESRSIFCKVRIPSARIKSAVVLLESSTKTGGTNNSRGILFRWNNFSAA